MVRVRRAAGDGDARDGGRCLVGQSIGQLVGSSFYIAPCPRRGGGPRMTCLSYCSCKREWNLLAGL